jgi:excinuclease ABC subunit A
LLKGTFDQILKSTSLTAKISTEDLEISVLKKRKIQNFIEIKGEREITCKN